ncbi:hypothetical protein BUALT_Bualt19G0057500 [Buddleja alternifolia]|uniref:Uncharacterized protein n=1 Tax=Buddleja alternifolia TaxID=168488 RepID=A0AAV6W021_9LAMI|nr:hypothetical protein BUALT_Bualt19G0057500 [Buddleja alternifolia]
MEEAKNSSRVKVHSILSVVSSNPIQPGKVHKLSLLDQSMGLHTLHIVFYYNSNPFNDGPMPSDIDNLRASLSHLLDKYPIATGRLTRGGPEGHWQVKCNDAGVRMLEASVSATLDEWLRSADVLEERGLTAWEDMPHDPSFWSPFRIQINNFKCGGLAIGLSCTHMHADITSATLLMKSWTQVHCNLPLTHSPIFHLPQPPTPSLKNSTPSFSPSKMGTATMKFSHSVIHKRLSLVQNHCPNATPFDVLVALLWSRIALWQEPEPDKNHNRSLSICVDSRNHGRPPIPYSYFGNALHFSVLSMDGDKLIRGGLGQVCEYVHQHIEGLKRDDFCLEVEGEGPFRVYGPRLTFINTEHMVDVENGEGVMYDAVFDKGEKPVHVSYHVGNVVGEGLIMVLPSSEGGLGRTVTVTLPEEQIANLCKDQAILDLEPIMLISGKK